MKTAEERVTLTTQDMDDVVQALDVAVVTTDYALALPDYEKEDKAKMRASMERWRRLSERLTDFLDETLEAPGPQK